MNQEDESRVVGIGRLETRFRHACVKRDRLQADLLIYSVAAVRANRAEKEAVAKAEEARLHQKASSDALACADNETTEAYIAWQLALERLAEGVGTP